jgi:hypothetical protein
VSAWQRQLEELKEEAKRAGDVGDPTKIPQRVVRGWRVLVTFADGFFNMSASLYPRGRSSVEDDWEALGRIVRVLGAPDKPAHMPSDPNAPVHYIWAGGDR